MGMFDILKVELLMPDTGEVPVGKDYQTKDITNTMDSYVIGADRRLYKEEWDYVWVEVPDIYFGGYHKPIEDTYRRVLIEDFHKDICFYDTCEKFDGHVVWRDYIARFTDGVLHRITYTDQKIPITPLDTL
jgi:hypothetical protein